MKATNEQGNTVSTMRCHSGGQMTWSATVFEGASWDEVIAELGGHTTEEAALQAGLAYSEPSPEDQTTCPRAANRQHHYAPQCQSAFCKTERVARLNASVRLFVIDAQQPGYDVRSRSECGGALVLYRHDPSSPTSVLGVSQISDTPENRTLLARAGVRIFMGAY